MSEEMLGAVGLICHLGKACFFQGLNNERIQTIVRSRGESILLSQAVEIALVEETPSSPPEKNSGQEGTPSGVQIAIG